MSTRKMGKSGIPNMNPARLFCQVIGHPEWVVANGLLSDATNFAASDRHPFVRTNPTLKFLKIVETL